METTTRTGYITRNGRLIATVQTDLKAQDIQYFYDTVYDCFYGQAPLNERWGKLSFAKKYAKYVRYWTPTAKLFAPDGWPEGAGPTFQVEVVEIPSFM